MIITFDKQTHTYAVNGDIAHISVTELLALRGTDTTGVALNKQSA